MKKTRLLMVLAIGIMIIQCGCGSKSAPTVGFLSDYSKLAVVSDSTLRYLPQEGGLRNYSRFIVEPIKIYFHEKSKASKIDEAQLEDLKQYMYWAIRNAFQGRYAIVGRPGAGVARVRIALTDLQKSNPVLNTLPQTKLAGVGLGGASMEAELVDSLTGRQIAALVETQKGKRLSLAGMKTWGDAKAVMDDWAKRFRERLDEAHGMR